MVIPHVLGGSECEEHQLTSHAFGAIASLTPVFKQMPTFLDFKTVMKQSAHRQTPASYVAHATLAACWYTFSLYDPD